MPFPHPYIPADIREDLGDGLILRWSRPEDAPHIARRVGLVFRDQESSPPNDFLQALVYRIMEGNHHWMGSDGYAVIEDTKKPEDPIAACVCLWQHRWSYAGIPFQVGRPEIVATSNEYRNRGLIRHLFRHVHHRSEVRGDLLQGITGIPNFYRQFGYEYVLNLDKTRSVAVKDIPSLKEGETEPYRLRPATLEDLPTIMELYHGPRHRRNSLVWNEGAEATFRYQIEGWKVLPDIARGLILHVLIDQQEQIIAYVGLSHKRYGSRWNVWDLAFQSEVNLQTFTPTLLRLLAASYAEAPVADGSKDEPLAALNFVSSEDEGYPLEAFIPMKQEPAYAWYLRVPDLLAFLETIRPVLNERLATSEFARYSGDLKLECYREGFHLFFVDGKITEIKRWRPGEFEKAPARIPAGVILKLIFGYRTLDELKAMYPDVIAGHLEGNLLTVLFPKQSSNLIVL